MLTSDSNRPLVWLARRWEGRRGRPRKMQEHAQSAEGSLAQIIWLAALFRDVPFPPSALFFEEHPIKRVSQTLAAFAILSFCEGLAHGQLLSPHGEASISGPALIYGYGFNQTVDGDTTFLQDTASYSFDAATVTGSAISHTVPNYSQFLGGQASSTQYQGLSAGTSAPYASTTATGIWRDVLFLNATGPVPPAVTFHFTVEGQMTYQYLYAGNPPSSYFDDYFSAQVVPPSSTGFEYGGPPTASIDFIARNGGFSNTTVQGFDSFTSDPSGGFTVTFSYIARYDPTLGGYGFQVTESAQATSYINDYSYVEWNDPLTANFVTNTDGTPLSGLTLSFDSGLILPSSVPEPSTWILAGTGSVIGLVVAAFRKRKERRRQRPVGPLEEIQ